MASITRIPASQLPAKHRRWNGSDASQRNHNTKVPIADTPMFLRLCWRRKAGAPAREVACMKLDLPALLREGYIRRDEGTTVRVRFVHDDDGHIYLCRTLDGPRWRASKQPF